MSLNVRFHRVYQPTSWANSPLSPSLRALLEASSSQQVGKYVVAIEPPSEEIVEFFDLRYTARAVVDDFGNLVRVS